jgi:hypothetical protein
MYVAPSVRVSGSGPTWTGPAALILRQLKSCRRKDGNFWLPENSSVASHASLRGRVSRLSLRSDIYSCCLLGDRICFAFPAARTLGRTNPYRIIIHNIRVSEQQSVDAIGQSIFLKNIRPDMDPTGSGCMDPTVSGSDLI